jgi:hypothetical protein
MRGSDGFFQELYCYCILFHLISAFKAALGFMPIMSAHVRPSRSMIGLFKTCGALVLLLLGSPWVSLELGGQVTPWRNVTETGARPMKEAVGDTGQKRTKERFSLPSQNRFEASPY